jgi:hypothetical protein
MSSDPVRILAQRQGSLGRERALHELWRRVDANGWLAAAAPRVVVHVGQRWRSDLVFATAQSLARTLAARLPSVPIEISDPGMPRDNAAPVEGEPTITIAGVAAHTLRVLERWFEPFFLVTVTGAGPDVATRMSAVLDAQGEPLCRLDGTLPPPTAAYEAHRLFASDLVVACTTARQADPTSEACWVAGTSDVAVEIALLRASGCDPSQMPYVRMLSAHEVLPGVEVDGVLPELSGYVGPAWRAEVHAARRRLATSQHAVVEDVIAVRRNLKRIPPAVRRRLANWKRGSG